MINDNKYTIIAILSTILVFWFYFKYVLDRKNNISDWSFPLLVTFVVSLIFIWNAALNADKSQKDIKNQIQEQLNNING